MFQNAFQHDIGQRLEIGSNIVEALPEVIRPIWKSRYDRVLSGERFQFEDAVPVENHFVHIEVSANPIIVNGKVIGASFFAADITERKHQQEALKESEEKYRLIVETSPNMVIIQRTDNKPSYISPQVESINGYTQEEISQDIQYPSFIHPDDNEKTLLMFNNAMNGQSIHNYEYRIIDKHGQIQWLSHSALPFFKDNRQIGVISTVQKITERKLAEERIQLLLTEKEMLLREVHHRIKNNMSIIKGLIFLQLEKIKNLETKQTLQEVISRLDAMNILYDKLYKSEGFKKISIKEYLCQLFDQIWEVFPEKKDIEIIKHFEDFEIDSKALSTISIMFNEMLINAIKYAFPENNKGTIHIRVGKKENRVSLIFHDTGIGISEEQKNNPHGFGLELIKLCVSQLHGTCRIENEKGTKYSIDFDLGK